MLREAMRHCDAGLGALGAGKNGRGRGIRTLDIQLPKLALYQAELYPEGRPCFAVTTSPRNSRSSYGSAPATSTHPDQNS